MKATTKTLKERVRATLRPGIQVSNRTDRVITNIVQPALKAY